MNAEPDWLEQSLFSQLSKQTFFEQVLGKRSYHTTLSREAVEVLPNWDDFNRFLSYERLSHPRVRVAQEGAPDSRLAILTQRRSRRGEMFWDVHADRIQASLRAGATLVMDAVDDSIPSVRAMAMPVAAHFFVRPQINAYMTFGDSRGFGLHWDDHDVIVVQIAGTKSWHMYGESREAPLSTDFHEEHKAPTTILETVHLKPGDVFYVPRGHWHDVVGQGEPTLHLTIGINVPTGIDLLAWLTDRARTQTFFRRDVPLQPRSVVSDYTTQFRAAVTELLSADFAREFLCSLQQNASGYPFLSLPYGIVDKCPPPPGALLRVVPATYTVERVDDAFVVYAGSRASTLPSVAEPLFNGLAIRPMSVKETWTTFGGEIEFESWQAFIGDLIHAGLLYISERVDRQ